MAEKPNVRQEHVKSKPPQYTPPEVITYDSDELLAELGPARACSGFTGAAVGC